MSEPPKSLELAAFVRAHLHEIVSAWEIRARQLPSARDLDRETLVDHVPPLLDRIADITAGSLEGRSVPLPRDLAEKHAEVRLEAGFSIGEIVEEYAMVRACIFDLVTRHDPSPSACELRMLDIAIDAAIAGSVEAYGAMRERWMQSLDRIGTAALESRSLADLLVRLMRIFVEATPSADTAAILLHEHGELRMRAAVGIEGEVERGFSLHVGEGFAGTIAATRAPLLIEDAAHHPLVRSEVLRRRGVRALFGVPLVVEDELLGVAHTGSLHSHTFSASDRALFQAMARRAASAIERAMLREATEQRARQQRAVAAFGWRALTTADLDEVLRGAVATLAGTLDVEMAKILELEPDGRMLLIRAGVGFHAGVVGRERVDAGPDSQAGYTLASDAAVIVDDLRSEQRFVGAPVLRRHGVVSGMTVVIRGAAGHGAFGVLGAHAREHRKFTVDDIAFLESLANIVAAAIERARFEHRVREAEERFRLIVEQVREYSMLMLDPAGRVESWTLGAQRMTGWEEQEVLGRGIASFFPPEDVRAGRPERLLARARVGGHVEDEGWRLRKDGTQFWASVSLTCLTDAQGRLRGFAAITRDLTDRRRAEGRHHFLADASRRLAESLDVDATLTAVAQLTIERLSDWCAIDVREDDGSIRRVTVEHRDPAKKALAHELEERYPLRPEDVPLQVMRTGQPVLVPEIKEELLRSGARDEEHMRLLRGLGLRSVLCVPMRVSGRVLGAISLASDDPRRLHDELDVEIAEELAQRAALALENARLYAAAQEAIARREELLAVVSHDLRNPLNVVHMGATLLAEGGTGSAGSVEEQATRILRAAHRMNRLIQDLLDLASIERGRLALVRAREDPAGIVAEAAEGFRAQASQRGLALEVDVAGTPPLIDADRDRVLQVLGNLVSNAVRITPKGGAVRLAVEAGAGEVVFSVRDTGPGIPEDELPHLFERHWRGRHALYRGTGRGLAIVKGIVDAHGGRVWVESEPGRGTAFYVALPAAPAQPT